MLVSRIAKWTLLSCLGSATGVIALDAVEFVDLTNYSSIRAVRTGIATVKTIVDYKWSLRKFNNNTSDGYTKAKSQVGIRYICIFSHLS